MRRELTALHTCPCRYYMGRRGYIAAQIALNGALQSLNIISVILSAQVPLSSAGLRSSLPGLRDSHARLRGAPSR